MMNSVRQLIFGLDREKKRCDKNDFVTQGQVSGSPRVQVSVALEKGTRCTLGTVSHTTLPQPSQAPCSTFLVLAPWSSDPVPRPPEPLVSSPRCQGFFRIIKNQGGGGALPQNPLPPYPDQSDHSGKKRSLQ